MSTINISNTKDRITFGKLIIDKAYIGKNPIIKVFLGDILIQNFIGKYSAWLLSSGVPSIYVDYCWQDEEVWSDDKYWTEGESNPVFYIL